MFIIIRLWDNLDDEQIISSLKDHLRNEIIEDINECAYKIATSAKNYSSKMNYLSPFAKKAQELKKYNYIGGKKDDITVIVAQIVMNSQHHSKFSNKIYL